MKNALEACKIRLQWHLRRFKKIIGIYDKIFILKFETALNLVMAPTPKEVPKPEKRKTKK